jgi:selenocysteine lyase/cysteine desulfurase
MTRDFDGHHFNTAGAGLNSATVIDAVTGYLRDEARFGSYETELVHADTLERHCYAAAAALLQVEPDDIALFDSATRAWTIAASLVPFAEGDTIWITPYEYAGNILALQAAITAHKLTVEVIPTDSHGDLDLDWMRMSLDHRVKLVSIVHIPSNCGIVLPIAEIGVILTAVTPKPFFFVDACQSVGLLPLDAPAIGCDVLTGAGRKFVCGPRGTAVAYLSSRFRRAAPARVTDLHVSEVHRLDRIVHLNDSAKRYELLERGNAAFVGLEIALRERHSSPIELSDLHAELTTMLSSHSGLRLIVPGRQHAGIVSFYSDRIPAQTIVEGLRAARINTWIVNARHTPLHMNTVGVERAVRTSVHHYNTSADIDALDRALSAILPASRPAQIKRAKQREVSQ